jgi:hypothetical protein
MAPLVQNPTCILAPNWTFVRGGSIELGNVIADPFRPHLVLARVDPNGPQPDIQTAREKDWQLQNRSGLSLTVGLWAKFTDSVGFKTRLKYQHRLGTAYSMTGLETIYYTDTLAQVQERVKDPVVRELLRLDNPYSKPVYMVTGLKIATGFRPSINGSLDDSEGREADAPASGLVPLTARGKIALNVTKKHKY